MLIEHFILNKIKGDHSNSTNDNHNSNHQNLNHQKKIVLAILNIILAFIAGYLCWNCNGSEKTWLRVLYTIISAVFSGLYMLYYLVYRVIMQVKCASGSSMGG